MRNPSFRTLRRVSSSLFHMSMFPSIYRYYYIFLFLLIYLMHRRMSRNIMKNLYAGDIIMLLDSIHRIATIYITWNLNIDRNKKELRSNKTFLSNFPFFFIVNAIEEEKKYIVQI